MLELIVWTLVKFGFCVVFLALAASLSIVIDRFRFGDDDQEGE